MKEEITIFWIDVSSSTVAPNPLRLAAENTTVIYLFHIGSCRK